MVFKKEITYNLNEVQVESLKEIKKLAFSAHFIDIKFRDSGQDKVRQADFLREIIKQL